MERVQFTGRSGRNLLPLVAAVALALTATGGVAQENGVSARKLNDYRQPAGSGPEIPWSATHGTSFSDDIMSMTHTKGPMVKRWHDGKRTSGPLGDAGLLSPFPAYVSPDGIHMWGVSARGRNTSHVHVWNRYTGERVWESPPWPGSERANPDNSEIGPYAVTSFITTDAEGNVYVADSKAVYSYEITPEGTVTTRWVSRFPKSFVGEGNEDFEDVDDEGFVQLENFPIGQALITETKGQNDRGEPYAYVGGASLQGFWTWVRSDTGEFVVAEPISVDPRPEEGIADAPPQFPSAVSCPEPLENLFLLIALTTPEVSPFVAKELLCATFGRGTPASESTSYEPETGFIYQYFGIEASEDDDLTGGEDRVITAHSFSDIPNEEQGTPLSMQQEWAGPRFQGGGATTPTVCSQVSKRGVDINGQVIVADGAGLFQSVGNINGDPLWGTEEAGEAALSPAVDKNCNLVAANRRELFKFRRGTGETIHAVNYDNLALEFTDLPELEPAPPLALDGIPKSNLLSVQVTGPDENITTLSFGYNVRVPDCFDPDDDTCNRPLDEEKLKEENPQLAAAFNVIFGSEQYSSHLSGYFLTDADDLSATDDLTVIDFEGGSVDTAQAPSVDGWVVGALTDVFGLIYENTTERLVPRRFKSPGPRFGYYALETTDHVGNAVKRLTAIQRWNNEAIGEANAGFEQYAFDVARRGVPALKPVAIPEELRRAEGFGDICAREVDEASAIIAEALLSQQRGRKGLLDGDPNSQVEADLEEANALIGEAIAVIERDVNNCNSNGPGNGNGPPGGEGPGNPLPPGLGGNPPPGQGGPNPGKGKGKGKG